MKLKEFSFGGKLILISLAGMILSIFLPWINFFEIGKKFGFQQYGYLFLLIWVYPVFTVLKRKEMKYANNMRIITLLNIIFNLIYMAIISFSFSGAKLSSPDLGMHLSFYSAITLSVGVFLYKNKSRDPYNDRIQITNNFDEE